MPFNAWVSNGDYLILQSEWFKDFSQQVALMSSYKYCLFINEIEMCNSFWAVLDM